MDIATMKAFFLWCTIINGGVLMFTSIVILFLRDFSFQMNHKVFDIPREAFSIGIFSFVALYKMVWIVFNLVPYLAQVIIG